MVSVQETPRFIPSFPIVAPSTGRQARALQPTVITYNSVLSALRSGGSWAGGRAVGPLLAQMREARLAPDAATYEAAVESLGGSLASTKYPEKFTNIH